MYKLMTNSVVYKMIKKLNKHANLTSILAEERMLGNTSGVECFINVFMNLSKISCGSGGIRATATAVTMLIFTLKCRMSKILPY